MYRVIDTPKDVEDVKIDKVAGVANIRFVQA
jgi:hypothetical protein